MNQDEIYRRTGALKHLGKEPLFFDYFIMGDEDMDRELQAILKPYDIWDNDVDGETNLRAKEALHDFYKTLLKRKPATNYEKDNLAHFREGELVLLKFPIVYT